MTSPEKLLFNTLQNIRWGNLDPCSMMGFDGKPVETVFQSISTFSGLKFQWDHILLCTKKNLQILKNNHYYFHMSTWYFLLFNNNSKDLSNWGRFHWKSHSCFNGNLVPSSIVGQQLNNAQRRQSRQISSWISSPRNISIPIQCVSINNIIICF